MSLHDEASAANSAADTEWCGSSRRIADVAQIRDLLIADPSAGDRLEIRSAATAGGMAVTITNLSKVTVTSAREAMAVYERGCALRAVAATGIHDLSSRSHSVLTIEVSGVYVTSGGLFRTL